MNPQERLSIAGGDQREGMKMRGLGPESQQREYGGQAVGNMVHDQMAVVADGDALYFGRVVAELQIICHRDNGQQNGRKHRQSDDLDADSGQD